MVLQYLIKFNYWLLLIWMSSSPTDLDTCGNTNSTDAISKCESFYKYGLSIMAEERDWRSELDRDPYPWIIWYIWKGKNDKLFRGIHMDHLETVRHAESECHAWFEAKQKQEIMVEVHAPEQHTTSKRCMIDGSWTHDALFGGYGWTWTNARGGIQLLGARNQTRRISLLHSELEALSWAVEGMLYHSTCQSFGTDCKDLISMIQDPKAWPNFSTEPKELFKLKDWFTEFSIVFFPRSHIRSSDWLAKIARSFHRELYFIGCLVRSGFSDHLKFLK